MLLLRLDATRCSSSASGGAVEEVEGGSGLTSEAERAYWIGQQLIWNPPTVSSLLNDGWGSIVLVFFVVEFARNCVGVHSRRFDVNAGAACKLLF